MIFAVYSEKLISFVALSESWQNTIYENVYDY